MRPSRILIIAIIAAACARGPAAPAKLEAGESCQWCRMSISDPHLAAQLAGDGREPLFFDDIGCMASFLEAHPADKETTPFVADHATGAWVDAAHAVYERCPSIETPMGSHVIAHADRSSEARDAASRQCVEITPAEVFAKISKLNGDRS